MNQIRILCGRSENPNVSLNATTGVKWWLKIGLVPPPEKVPMNVAGEQQWMRHRGWRWITNEGWLGQTNAKGELANIDKGTKHCLGQKMAASEAGGRR
jgi:hypothetical protein